MRLVQSEEEDLGKGRGAGRDWMDGSMGYVEGSWTFVNGIEWVGWLVGKEDEFPPYSKCMIPNKIAAEIGLFWNDS